MSKEAAVSGIFEKAQQHGLVNIDTQWLFLVSDSNSASEMKPKEILNSQDGSNLAFIYNMSNTSEDCKVSCQRNGLKWTEKWALN